MTQRLRGKTVLFLLVDGFESDQYIQLRDRLLSWGAALATASMREDQPLTSADGRVQVESDLSFSQAAQQRYEAVIVADGVTGKALQAHPEATNLISRYWKRGSVVATVGGGAYVSLGAGVVEHLYIACLPEMADALTNAGATAAITSIAISDNMLTARPDADMQLFCDDIAHYLAVGQAKAA